MDKEYPADLMEFEEQFGTEEACREYLIQLRWPEGYVEPVPQVAVRDGPRSERV